MEGRKREGGKGREGRERERADTPPSFPFSQDALQDGIPDDGMYHGAAAYKSHIVQREDEGSAKFKAGPVKASSNIRTITVIDYQPDVCKDYKGELSLLLFFLYTPYLSRLES